MDTAATNTTITDAWRITLRIGNLEHSANQQCRQRLVYCSREMLSSLEAFICRTWGRCDRAARCALQDGELMPERERDSLTDAAMKAGHRYSYR